MWRQRPLPMEHIPVSLGIYRQLRLASAFTDDEKEVWEIVAEPVDQWMRLFLPNGTLLRTVSNGKNYHCIVEADALNYDGNAVSSSGFVNAVGGIRRNAWKCTWLLLPDSKEWKLADSLRTIEHPRRARKFPSTPRHAPATQPSTLDAPAAPAPAIVPAACGAPLNEPEPAQAAAPASAAPMAGTAQNIFHESGSLSAPAGDGRRRRRADRRMHGEDPLATLLQQCLLPLLQRMCASEVDRPGPFSTARAACHACPPPGIALSRVRVYACCGLRYSSSESASSTTPP